jgi:hypothetical protein
MSTRSYHAFIKAARKTGGLSLPAARKAYHKMKDRLGRQPKGIDVKKHPRIFKQSLVSKSRKTNSSAKAAGVAKNQSKPIRAARTGKGSAKPTQKPRSQARPQRAAPQRVRRVTSFERFIESFEDFMEFFEDFEDELLPEVEYVSTAEY